MRIARRPTGGGRMAVMGALVEDAMTRRVLSASPNDTVFQVENATRRAMVHRIVITDQGRAVGIVCRCGLAAARAGAPVWHAMRAPAITISTRESLVVAAAVMREHRIGCLPALDRRDALAGILTRRDLRRLGALSEERGIQLCVSCGTSHDVPPARSDRPTFCGDCLERARGDPEFGLYGTLGGSG